MKSRRPQPQRPPADLKFGFNNPIETLGLLFVYFVLIVFIITIVVLGVMTLWHRPLSQPLQLP